MAEPQGATRREFIGKSAATAAMAGIALQSGVHAAGSDTIKIGMIGAGGRCTGAAANAMNVDKGVQLVAACDIFMDRVKGKVNGLRGKYKDQVAVDDAHCFDGTEGYKHVIENVDVVLIANAAKFHPFHMRKALEAGKHVFVEKPHAIDPGGVKDLVAACKLAEEKKLSIVSGLQSRFHPAYQETVKRIHDGAIGDVVAIEENFLRGPYGLNKRKPGLTELQYQFSNQYHYTWLSGDDVPQSLIHNIDRSLWVLKEETPVDCHGMGGRSGSFGEVYGDVFDHHHVVYRFKNGVRLYANCRTTFGCYNESSSIIMGSKGRASVTHGRIDGETKWSYKGPRANPYDEEHRALYQSIRNAKPINSGYHMANATLTTVMGQLSCYTGEGMTWDKAQKSDFYHLPKPGDVTMDTEPPTKPGPDGQYPHAIPGVTEVL